MIAITKDTNSWMHGLALVAFLSASTPGLPLLAQGILDDKEVQESIVGSEVTSDDADETARIRGVVAAIENTEAATQRVRKIFNVDGIDIVFLGWLAEEDAAEDVRVAISDQREQIGQLQFAVESSALLYHALNSQSVEPTHIVAVEIDEEDRVTMYARGKPRN